RKEYLLHLERMFQLMGDDEAVAKKNAQTIMDMETRLAKASMTRVELRDPYASYNRMTIDEASKIAPSMQWSSLFGQMGVTGQSEFIMGQPKFFAEVEKVLKERSIDDWKTYLKWH